MECKQVAKLRESVEWFRRVSVAVPSRVRVFNHFLQLGLGWEGKGAETGGGGGRGGRGMEVEDRGLKKNEREGVLVSQDY